MNIQTERLENHTARLTVEVDSQRLEKAKQSAARKISGKYNIPGFRKGKAPYRVIVNYFGEAPILEEAFDELGNEIYKEILKETDLDIYGPGQLEDVKTEGETPVFQFIVALQPEVELGDYRAVRADFETTTIEDKDVDTAMKALREQHAVVEESHQPVALGNRVVAYIDGRLADEEGDAAGEASEAEAAAEPTAEASAEAEHDEHDHEHDHDHDHEHHVDEKTVIHEHEATLILDDEAIAPGFAQALVGANVGDEREFELTYPDDAEEYEELAGKRVKFHVEILKIENVTLPSLNDDFAARVTADEENPLTLLELRIRMRENLQKMAEERATSDYATDVLTKMIEGSTIKYPEALVAEQVEHYVEHFDQDLRKQGLTLADYKRIYGKTDEELYQVFRDPALKTLERALVLRSLMAAEKLTVSDEEMDAEIEQAASQFGERAEDYRRLFQHPNMRENMRNDLLNRRLMERVAAIGRNEAPELPQDESPEEPAAEPEVTPAATEDVSEE